MLWSVFLCLWVQDFGRYEFSVVDNESVLPHLVIPFYPHMTEVAALAREFAEVADLETGFAAAAIDCSFYESVCAERKLVPGKMSVSVPPFNKLKVSSRPVTAEGLADVAKDLKVRNVHQLRSMEDVERLAKRANLFAIVARDNAGDLEMKIPRLNELAARLVHYDVVFGIAREPSVYDRFAEYPLTAFVRITANLEYDAFRGDFSLGRLADFVVDHYQKPWGHWTERSGVAVVHVGKKMDGVVFEGLEARQSLVFVNSSEEKDLANAICGRNQPCDAVVDFKKCRSLRIPNEANVSEFVADFDGEFGKLPLVDRLKCSATLAVYLYRNVCILLGGCVGVLLVIFILSFLDAQLKVEDTRVKSKSKKK